ncbi:MAG: transporter [Methylovirgula sp.]
MKISSKLIGASLAALGAMSLCTVSGAALAGSISQPGELVGYTWAPLPQGLYFADTGSYGNDRALGAYNSELGVNIPVIVWSTPWDFLGGHVEAYVAVPSVVAGIPDTAAGPGTGTYVSAIYNPALLVGESWNLGGGWGISDFVGGYAPVDNALDQDNWTFNERLGVTWSGNGFTLTGHLIVGITGDDLSNSWGTNGQHVNPDYINLDLAAWKSFGKFSFGPVAFGSWDISGATKTALDGSMKQSQFAVGGMGGYDFGPVILQSYLTHDVAVENYPLDAAGSKVYETRGWVRVIVPLWNPPAPPAPVIAKY